MPDILRDAVILTVDDNPATRYLTSRTLRLAGCTVVEAATGPAALEIASRGPVDLILLDVNLPGMDGFEVVRHLKADPATAPPPVLHTSALSIGPDSISRALENGADGYLTAPVSAEVLLSTVRALLRMRRAVQEAERRAEELRDALAQLQAVHGELEVANEELGAANEELQTAHDELAQQQAALRENEERYRQLHDTMLQGVVYQAGGCTCCRCCGGLARPRRGPCPEARRWCQ